MGQTTVITTDLKQQNSVSISSWTEVAIDALSDMGVFCGNADGTFSPGGVMSIEQMIVVSFRCWEYCVEAI